MGTLTCDCTVGTPIELAAFPNSCGAENYGFPYKLLVMKTDGSFTSCSGDSPNLANIQAAQLESDENKLLVIGPITNGQRTEADRETEEGADTTDGLVNVISQSIQITGKLKFLDETIREDLEGLNCYERLRLWVVTDTGWLFGGCTGYSVANFISGLLHDGYGTRAYVPIDYKFKAPGHDPATFDIEYLDLVNT